MSIVKRRNGTGFSIEPDVVYVFVRRGVGRD